MYYTTPNYSIACNAKVGCTTMANAILKQFYPEIIKKIEEDKIKNPDYIPRWIGHCQRAIFPEKPVVLLVRNPVERFISALSQFNIQDCSLVIDALHKNEKFPFPNSKPTFIRQDPHFRLQSELLYGESHLFKFPDHIHEAMKFVGIDFNPEHLNKAKEKISLTKDQLDFIQFYYYDDIKLFEQIKEPNTIVKV